MPHPYLSARSLACLAWTSLTSRRSALVPTNTMSGLSQYALACSWPEKTRASHSNPCDAWNTVPKLPLFKVKICISPLCGNERKKSSLSKDYWSEAEQAAEMTRTHPVPDVEETLLIGQVEHQQEAHGISEESCGEAAESENRWTTFVLQ